MATQRARVPTVLHAELTEYTNLVRVLRTTRTLDLTSQLVYHAQHRAKDREADTWTTWPLIDCPVPEWSLEDEIHQLGETVARQYRYTIAARVRDGEVDPSTDYDGPNADVDADVDADSDSDSDSDLEGLSPAAAKRLVLHTASVLVHILNLMADQRPSAPGSMQNRLWAMNWEDVISLLAVGGVVDATIVARAQKRLERIYGPSTTNAVERLQRVASTKARFSGLAAVQEDQLFAPPVLSRTRRRDAKSNSPLLHTSHSGSREPIATRQSHKSGAKSCAVAHTDMDVDA